MKITGIEIKHYLLPLDPPFKAAWDPEPRRKFASTVVYVHTDEGITGVGSGDLMMGFDGHEHLFIGQDPFAMERHSQIIENIDFHYGRCWPLDLALWDLIGKASGQPVYKLLGGRSNKLLAYASTGEMVTPQERAERAVSFVEQGFKAMKIRFHHKDVKDDIKVVEAVRKAVGDKLEIMVDANQGWKMPWDVERTWDLKMAYQVAKELEQLQVFWLEEPLPAHQFELMAKLRDSVGIRIAGGEMNRNWHDFREMNKHQSLDVYQPDVALSGGITRTKKIAELVQGSGGWFSPHTWTNGVGLLANLHLAAAISHCPYLEFPYDPPAWSNDRRDFIQKDRLMIDGEGYLVAPEKPGLGIELDEEALKKYEVNHFYVGESQTVSS
ncbi:mandelate racemase/muconate lactonizing enzyme family protein [Peribacillus muralis]|uniref:mandelate racemase/muconate lactonizing enzyme family protein n=1 Tax=Peribacillus muralis TaxID=264697 RepID=UPI001F4E6485|nr:mandelate racemase/muconate lactonizing enzyme family protein [Peribacillus muralis]MCK1992274.1 mandelate racemase/muconate lactonizing enzyme family protein [Peribacillus muralis]MCK2012830.1 mandelate racemase/muconate lactonizing enzyme family protein [Peribacillus muralis]